MATKKMAEQESEMTVEEYLNQQCEIIIANLQKHSSMISTKLRQEYQDGANGIKLLMQSTKTNTQRLCVVLKCIGGSHLGQKFRLEPGCGNGEDVFKLGRSTGKTFKEKGVSLYKDKEISTTHAKIEIRNGQVFLVDNRSTNGTLLNGEEITPQVPLRLQDNDVICMGSTELQVQLTILDDMENACAML